MRLIDLRPKFLGHGGEGVTNTATGAPVPRREGVGLQFDCPCGCGIPCFVHFSNPLDGGAPLVHEPFPSWQRTGDTFETLTLTPSILRTPPRGCGWHGYITNGEVIAV